MKRFTCILMIFGLILSSCENDSDSNGTPSSIRLTFRFSHNWDGTSVTNANFNTIQYTNENGDMLSIERLRYVISDIELTGGSGEQLSFDVYNLVDVTNNNGLNYELPFLIPPGNYTNLAFTFGLDNEDNAENYQDLNAASFNVPDMLGGGYHYMQLDGKYLDGNSNDQNYNYHAIRAVDNPGPNPTFPQDTFFTVNLGPIVVGENAEVEVLVNLAEWFKNPNTWDLNVLNTELMANSAAQILMFQNGQTVFSLGDITVN